jgi:hypothetical protein
MVLERRVRSLETSSRQPNGEWAGFGCDEDDDDSAVNHGHAHFVKARKNQREFALRSLVLLILAAAFVMIGKEFVETRVHEVEHRLHNVESHVQQVDNLVHQFESSARESASKPEPVRPAPQAVEVTTPEAVQVPKPLRSAPKEPKVQEAAPRDPLFGKLNYGIYRFKAEKLGRRFLKAVEFFDAWIGQDVDPVGAAFAKQRVQMPGVAEFHNDCFHAPDSDRMLNLEEKKKSHKFRDQGRRTFLAEEQALFYNTSNVPKSELVHVTANSQWAWRTAALFSAQYSGTQSEFRKQINDFLSEDKYLAGSVSGTFWYPPNAIREWHTNAWDISVDKNTGKMKKPWRMYFVRQKPERGSDGIVEDRSAFHLMDGNGIPVDRLESVGAYRLTHNKNSEPDVWRLPDRNGYVSLFRLQVDEPYRWHCIVSETVHRYSLGMSLSDEEVEALLEHVGVEL